MKVANSSPWPVDWCISRLHWQITNMFNTHFWCDITVVIPGSQTMYFYKQIHFFLCKNK